MRLLFLSFLLALTTLSAADLTGKWEGSYDVTMADGQTMKGKVNLNITQTGSDVTGTIGSDQQPDTQISKGQVDGDQLTFELQTEGPLMKFTLHLEEEHLRGAGKGESDGDAVQAKLDLTRKAE